jgi:hypothetical protein
MDSRALDISSSFQYASKIALTKISTMNWKAQAFEIRKTEIYPQYSLNGVR